MSCPVIELTQQLIRRPSLSPDDAGCQALLIERLQAIGFTVERMDFADTQNFWAWRGQGETLAFAGHTDVVPPGDADRWINPPFEPTIRDGMLFGRRCQLSQAVATMQLVQLVWEWLMLIRQCYRWGRRGSILLSAKGS